MGISMNSHILPVEHPGFINPRSKYFYTFGIVKTDQGFGTERIT